MYLNKISDILVYTQSIMSEFQHQKKALVIQLYQQGKTRRQIAEVVHMSFKDIANVITKHTGEESISLNKPEKSKDARAFELFLKGKQSVEVAIELDMSADEVEELHVQYWRLSKLDDLEILYHEAEYSLSLLLQLHDILKDNKITKDKDIRELMELANHGLPNIRYSVNNEIIRKKNLRLRTLDRKLTQLEVMLQHANKEPNYYKKKK
jgi:hypothetical protein